MLCKGGDQPASFSSNNYLGDRYRCVIVVCDCSGLVSLLVWVHVQTYVPLAFTRLCECRLQSILVRTVPAVFSAVYGGCGAALVSTNRRAAHVPLWSLHIACCE